MKNISFDEHKGFKAKSTITSIISKANYPNCKITRVLLLKKVLGTHTWQFKLSLN